MSDVFRFKQFSMSNRCAGLKVGTDGVLLGAAADITALVKNQDTHSDTPFKVLDIGTGTGVIALMLAQRLSARGIDFEITAIDINAAAINEASLNFMNSPWNSRLHAVHMSLEEFQKTADQLHFDLIVSNPPYFENSLRCPDEARDTARHTASMSWRDIAAFVAKDSSRCRLSLILPADQLTTLRRYCASFSLVPTRILSIRTTAVKAPKRIIAEFERNDGAMTPPQEQILTMQDNGKYTQEYISIVKDFYLDSYFLGLTL